MEVVTSEVRGDESALSLPVASPLSVDGIATDIIVEDDSTVDNNDNSNSVRNMAAVKDEDFAPDTPTSCISINTIQVKKSL